MIAPRKRTLGGPGWLVAAAFIGPGTVTTATRAGAIHGHALLWTVVFSILATIVLQDMAARVGLGTRTSLGAALRASIQSAPLRWGAALLVVGAVAIGNAAFQTGNLKGAALGMELLTGQHHTAWVPWLTLAAGVLLWFGRYRMIEALLVGLVAIMSLAFVAAAVWIRPDVWSALRALVSPTIPDQDYLTVLALIGTTVVPYNLFLHASTVAEKWPSDWPLRRAVSAARWDTAIAVTVGGLLTVAIMLTSAAAGTTASSGISAADMARQLEPLLGPAGRWLFAAGLAAAGLTSAITAPLAAAYATCGVCGWPTDLRSPRFRAVWSTILLAGALLAYTAREATATIVFAQATNALILPIIAVFLLWVMNTRTLPEAIRNRLPSNLTGGVVVLIAATLGIVKLLDMATRG